MDDGDVQILSIKSISSSVNNIYLHHREELLSSENAKELVNDFRIASVELNEYQQDVVEYVAGFILRKLCNKKWYVEKKLNS